MASAPRSLVSLADLEPRTQSGPLVYTSIEAGHSPELSGSAFQSCLIPNLALLADAVDTRWMQALEASAHAHGTTWMHQLLLAVAYIEAGEMERPRKLLQAALQQPGGRASPIVARNLAILADTPAAAWPLFELAWNLTLAPPPSLEPAEVSRRLAQNVADEILQFLIGNLAGATTGAANVSSVWYGRLKGMASAAQMTVGPAGSDTILLARVVIDVSEERFSAAMETLSSQCFPTLGRGRDVLISLWRACAVGRSAAAQGRPLSPAEAHRARKAAPVPRNIGCPYATLYCEQYW